MVFIVQTEPWLMFWCALQHDTWFQSLMPARKRCVASHARGSYAWGTVITVELRALHGILPLLLRRQRISHIGAAHCPIFDKLSRCNFLLLAAWAIEALCLDAYCHAIRVGQRICRTSRADNSTLRPSGLEFLSSSDWHRHIQFSPGRIEIF